MKTTITLSLLAVALGLTAPARADEAGKRGPCRADVEKFCQDVKPGGGRLVDCLKAHENDLSAECKAAGQKAHERFAQARKDFESACDQDRQKLCKDAKPGREMMECFRQHNDQLSDSCKSMIQEHRQRFMQSHPKMAAAIKACRDDQRKFCKDVKPGEGRIRDCMKQHESELSDACRGSMGGKANGQEGKD